MDKNNLQGIQGIKQMKKIENKNVYKYLFKDKILLRLENSIQLPIYLFSKIPRKLVIIVLVDLKLLLTRPPPSRLF